MAEASGEEADRLKKLGLVEVEVRGTHLKLLAQADPNAAPPTLEQRYEMAKRLNEVGPLLPRYVKKVVKADAANEVRAVEEIVNAGRRMETDMPKKQGVTGTAPSAAQVAEITKAHAENLKEVAQHDREKAAREAEEKKAKEKKEAAGKAARKAAKQKLEEERAAARKAAGKKKKPAAKPEPKKAEKKADAKKGDAKKAEPKKKGGIGNLICDLLKKGKATDDVLKEVKKQFPKAATSAASIAWYRSKLRQEGALPKG